MIADSKYYMRIKKSTLKSEVYHLDVKGVDGTWLWDFGSFTLIGSEDFPSRRPDTIFLFSSAVNGVDVESIDEMNPYKTVEVEIYEGDYCIYIDSTEEYCTHALSPEKEPYAIVEKNVSSSKGEEDLVVLKEDKSHGKKSKVAISREKLAEDWNPIKKV